MKTLRAMMLHQVGKHSFTKLEEEEQEDYGEEDDSNVQDGDGEAVPEPEIEGGEAENND
jgi:hypothetical protein